MSLFVPYPSGGGSGINQLTGSVSAGPGSGSQAALVLQIDGTGGVAPVINGTGLAFEVTGDAPSTNARCNFVGDAAQVWLGYRYSTVDYPLIASDGANNLTIGNTGAGLALTIKAGFDVVLQQTGVGNTLSIAASGAVVNSTKWTVNSTPTYFDAGSNVTIGATAPDFGGGVGGILAIAPITTPPTTAPASNFLIAQGPNGLHSLPPNATPAYFADYMLAPTWQGPQNTQALQKFEYAGTANTTSSVGVVVIPVPLGKVVTLDVLATARVVSGGTPGDGASIRALFQFKNVAGTVTQATTIAAASLTCDASLASVNLTAFVTGSNCEIQVNNGVATGVPPIDWTVLARAIIN